VPQTSQACRPAAAAHGPLRTGVLGAAAAALATLPVAKALALDLDGDMGLITETVASRDRLKSYDSIKLYGAERVADRDRKYVLPDGILAGNYLIFPSLGAAVVYDDNIFKSNADKRSDVRSEITPSLHFTSQLPRHVLDLSLDGKIVSYLDNPDQDYADIRARLDGALHFDHAHTLAAGILSAIEHEEVRDIAAPADAAEPTTIFHNRATTGITRDVGRLYGTLSTSFESWDYEDVKGTDGTTIDQDVRDLDLWSATLKAGSRFSPGFEAIGKVRGLRALNDGIGAQNRDSTGYEVAAGVAFETSPLLRWRLLGGYGLRDFDEPGQKSVDSLLLEGEVQWLPTQRVTVYGTVSRAIVDTLSADAGGRVETAFHGRLDYDLWHSAVLRFDVEVSEADFTGADRRDRTYGARIGLDYYYTKNWLFSLGYEHQFRDSTDDAFDMSRNRFTVGAKLRF
jgi:hypothetical protein